MDPYWWPICDDCDVDAVGVAPPAGQLWWRFACDRHATTRHQPLQRVRAGLRPPVQDRAWRAALAAIQGVLKPTEEELSYWRAP